MKKLYPLLLVPIMLSCTNDTTYTYIQVNDTGLSQFVEDKPEKIKAENDSLAYLQAFKHYVMGQKKLDK